ncbi:hypothetical protein [Hahella ganghwensis]|uniref:hypothetical protein n=1 Tax=Hahella ganghwensis TaxID=286420 RepID=UPI00037064A6|nr:hypothetical protein [Hahella ganghwensis]
MVFKPDNLRVIVCGCVFRNKKPILYVYHGEKNWQFLCGDDHESTEGASVVGIGHLIERDPSLNELADLSSGWEAERESLDNKWVRNEAE